MVNMSGLHTIMNAVCKIELTTLRVCVRGGT